MFTDALVSPQRFIGYWADVTQHIKPDTQQTLTLTLPGAGHSEYVISPGFFNAGNDLGLSNVTASVAEQRCSKMGNCIGFTFEKSPDEAHSTCDQIINTTRIHKTYFKSSMSGRGDNSWCKVTKRAVPVGVFWENVQPLHGGLEIDL